MSILPPRQRQAWPDKERVIAVTGIMGYALYHAWRGEKGACRKEQSVARLRLVKHLSPAHMARQDWLTTHDEAALGLEIKLARDGAVDAMLLIIWHSRTGAAEAMARAAYAGAQTEGPCLILRAQDVTVEAMLKAQAYLFCCPENLGLMTGAMKEFFDGMYYPLLGRTEGRSYATMIAAGTDGTGAQRQIDRIVAGWRLRRVSEPLIIRNGAQTPDDILAPKILSDETLQKCYELGQALTGGMALGVF